MEIISQICSLIVIISIMITLPASIIWFLHSFFTRKNKKKSLKLFLLSIACIFVFSLIGGLVTFEKVDDKSENVTTTAAVEESKIKVATEQLTTEEQTTEEQTTKEVITKEETTKKKELSKKKYKELCTELFYEEIFFGNDNLENKNLKLELFVSEDMFFTDADYISDDVGKIIKDNKLYRDFKRCCVLHETKDSYVGRFITVFFSEDFKLDPNDYKPGDKFTAYGKVIYWSDNTMDGYNRVYFIPKYIDKK